MISLQFTTPSLHATIPVPASKSESNRALIMAALCEGDVPLHNLASARDTQTMLRLLSEEKRVWDVGDAGTTMRFLTAFAAATGRHKHLCGTPRMHQRPIGILVDALRQLGANIAYEGKPGYPPMEISGGGKLSGGKIQIRGDVSSQFISALMMVGPTLTEGLSLELTGKIGSRPYIQMTLELMRYFGVSAHWDGNLINIPSQRYHAKPYTIETDWSGVSYWYSMVALAKDAEIFVPGLRSASFQGDARISELMRPFGVETRFEEGGIRLAKKEVDPQAAAQLIDLSDEPDLAQTLAVVAAALEIPLHMTGLESLRIKETDRIAALQQELAKFNCTLTESSAEIFAVGGKWQASHVPVHTYEDHRMAMAFAPLALRQSTLAIEDPGVVAKSYPEFWDHMELAGGRIQQIEAEI